MTMHSSQGIFYNTI